MKKSSKPPSQRNRAVAVPIRVGPVTLYDECEPISEMPMLGLDLGAFSGDRWQWPKGKGAKKRGKR